MCYILSMTSPTRCTLRRAQQGGHKGGGSSPCRGPGQRPSENFLVLNFWWVVCVHGFVHGFAHGFGVRWFLATGIFVDPVKGTTVMF